MKYFGLTVFVLLGFIHLHGQTAGSGKNEFSVWGGFSPDSSTEIKALGRTPDVRFGLVSIRYSRRFNNNDAVNLKYTADITPAAFANYPDALSLNSKRRSAYGFGVSPLGLQANFRPRKTVQPFVGTSGGMMYFDKRMPNALGTRFTFTADIGAGVEIMLKEKRSVTLGYKYFHISNAGRGDLNPGIDNNLFYVGYTFFSK